MTKPNAFLGNTRTRQILEDLEAVRENLLALSEDIWRSIDHDDQHALEEGFRFKKEYNEKVKSFNAAATDLSALVQQFTSVKLDASEQTSQDDRKQYERIIAELNRNEPHSLSEDFTFKRPHGFIFGEHAVSGITTWQRLYELFLI